MLGLSCRIKSQDLGGASGPGLGSAYASPAQGHFLSAIIFTVLHFRVCVDFALGLFHNSEMCLCAPIARSKVPTLYALRNPHRRP